MASSTVVGSSSSETMSALNLTLVSLSTVDSFLSVSIFALADKSTKALIFENAALKVPSISCLFFDFLFWCSKEAIAFPPQIILTMTWVAFWRRSTLKSINSLIFDIFIFSSNVLHSTRTVPFTDLWCSLSSDNGVLSAEL
ncbi:hypothetical protein BpHYR1_033744 [Brachionus plicatilis]|uniref:Uncharacterized protein n=1 Tax=Brachionus plicatilis TaxID=10195 RepID=A0A3M7T258_BRAPC|nr:hypothetical protein BpHYR1_033744 [Brachionus plicatilis]